MVEFLLLKLFHPKKQNLISICMKQIFFETREISRKKRRNIFFLEQIVPLALIFSFDVCLYLREQT